MEQSVKDILADDFWIMPATPEYIDEGVPYITSKNIKNGIIDFTKVNYISQDAYENISKNRPILVGDILISMIGTLGETAEVKESDGSFYGQNMFLVRLDESKINKRYFLNFFKSNCVKRALEGKQNQSTQKYLKANHIEDLLIPVPALDEQKLIAKQLDKLAGIIALRNEELKYLDDIIRARFVEMFGEYYKNHINEKQLDEICDFIDYRGKTPEKSESGIPLITAKNVKDNRFSIEPQEFIPEENYDDVMTRGIPRVNDVLFTTEAPLGNVCRIPDVYERFCVGQRLITMQPHTDVINPEYLEHALTSAEFQEKMWQKSSGSTVKGIRSKLLVLLTIPVPPIELQNQFRDFLKQVDKSKVVCVFGRLACTQIKRV